MWYYVEQENLFEKELVIDDWYCMVFYLFYVYQAWCMFLEIFWEESLKWGDWECIVVLIDQFWLEAVDFEFDVVYQKVVGKYLCVVIKIDCYWKFVVEKIEKGEWVFFFVGNFYIFLFFLSLMSILEVDLEEV